MSIAPAAVTHYEALRAHVLGEQPSPEYGWALFVRRGMLAWCALRAAPEAPACSQVRPRGLGTSPRLVDIGSPVIAILASMVLALQPEVPNDA